MFNSSGSSTGYTPNPRKFGIENLGVLGACDPDEEIAEVRAQTITEMYKMLSAAIRDGRATMECVVDSTGQSTMRVISTSTKAGNNPVALCPACLRSPITQGYSAPLGPNGMHVKTCNSCAALPRSVDSVYREE